MKLLAMLVLLGTAISCGAQSAAYRNKQYTVEEIKQWSAQSSRDRWHGWILYKGSDSATHYFIAREMDQWHWFRVNKTALEVPELRAHSMASNARLGYYYVDPRDNFRKVKDYAR